MEELASVLRRERSLLELLLFRLTETRHLLAAGETRFLGWAVTEVERALERLRDAELSRASLVSGLARTLEVRESDLTLSRLAEVSPEPYRSVFADHRRAFLELVEQVQETARANRQLATGGAHGLREVLASILPGEGDAPFTYGPDRTRVRAGAGAARLDWSL